MIIEKQVSITASFFNLSIIIKFYIYGVVEFLSSSRNTSVDLLYFPLSYYLNLKFPLRIN